MNTQLEIKVSDFTKWALNSFEHFYNNRFADALTNMRKSGEAASKLIIINKYFGSSGEQKIAEKGYKELINLLIAESLVPRKVINWLETIQIHGNIATHDNQVIFSQAEYGVIALQMLVIWLFNEYLNTDIPVKLTNYINQQWDIKKMREQIDLLENDLDNARNKAQKFKQGLENSEQQSQKNTEKALALKNELENEITNTVKELDKSKQKISQLQDKLRHASKETEQLKIKLKKVTQEEIISVSKPEKSLRISKKKIIGICIGIILLIGITYVILYNPFKRRSYEETEVIIPKTEEKPFTVLILPFSVLQDNPNIVIKLEDAILRRLVQKSEDNNLSMQVLYNPEKDKAVLSYKQALDSGKKQKANIIIFGELYEQASGDSVQVTVKYISVGDDGKQQLKGETKIKSFAKLTDIKAGNLQAEIECIIDMSVAINLIKKGYHSEALMVINEIDTVSEKYCYADLSYLKSECYYKTGKYSEARKELLKSIKFYPEYAYYHDLSGRISTLLEQYDEAERSFQKAIELDTNNIDYLLNYAGLLSQERFKNYKKCKEILLTALEKDPTNPEVYYYIAEFEVLLKNYKEAEKNFIKALELNPGYTIAKRNYAKNLAFNLNRPQEAVSYLYEAIKEDSTDYYSHFILGNIFIATELKNIEKALNHFLKSKDLQSDPPADIFFVLGNIYYEKNDLKTAESYYMKALDLDSSNIEIYSKIIQLYRDLEKREKVKFYLEKAYLLDSSDRNINFNYGIFYASFENHKYYNEKKAIEHFEKALISNPADEITLQYLGTLCYVNAKYTKAKNYFLRLIKINPENFEANYNLGLICEREAEYKQAKMYYDKALSVDPNVPEVYSKLSVLLVQNPFNNTVLALHYAQEADKMNSKNGKVYFEIAQVYFFTGNKNMAVKHYNTAIDLNPNLKNEEFENLLYNDN